MAELDHNQANMTFGFWIFDDLNNGQLLANSRTLLSESYASKIEFRVRLNSARGTHQLLLFVVNHASKPLLVLLM